MEEILALEETADAEMKEDDENVKGKAEKEEVKVTDTKLKALEKVSETMKRHSGENDQEKVKNENGEVAARPCCSCPKKRKKTRNFNLRNSSQLKKEQHDLDAKRLQTSIDQQRQFQQQ